MKDRSKRYFLVFIAIWLLTVIGLSIFSYTKIKEKEQQTLVLQESLDKLQLNYNSMKETYNKLKSEHSTVQNEYSTLKNHSEDQDKKMTSLNKSMRQTEIEAEKVIEKLEDFEIEVRESMEWFRNNSNLGKSEEYERIKKRLKKECINIEEGVCNISLDCIYDENKEEGIIYKTDIKTYDKIDFLKSLDLISKHKGGDCEDFAFLFKAEYNYLIDECRSRGYYSRKDIATHARGTSIDAGYMYVVCGTFDSGKSISDYSGHCVVAIVNSTIKKASDIYENLKHAALIEPQTGRFMYYLNETDEIILFKDKEAPDTLYHVSLIITKDDLKIFYIFSEEIEWVGYSEFLDKISVLKERLKEG